MERRGQRNENVELFGYLLPRPKATTLSKAAHVVVRASLGDLSRASAVTGTKSFSEYV